MNQTRLVGMHLFLHIFYKNVNCAFVCVFFLFVCVEVDELQFNASPDEFTSKKVTTKILQQIEVRKHTMQQHQKMTKKRGGQWNCKCQCNGRKKGRNELKICVIHEERAKVRGTRSQFSGNWVVILLHVDFHGNGGREKKHRR